MRPDFETLASGYGLAEAPRWDGSGVYFTDVLGGGIYRWDPDGVQTVLGKRRGVGGLALRRDGTLVASGRELIAVEGDGDSRVLLEPEHGIAGFNDLCVDGSDRIYAGALRFRPFAGDDPVPGDVWRLDPNGGRELLFRGIHWPNGIGVSPDGGTLYCCDYANGTVIAHDLDDLGRTAHWRLFASSPSGEADGLAVDAEGGVWVATGNGASVVRFGTDGALNEVVEAPTKFVSALCFGAEQTDLFVTTMGGDAGGSLMRARL